MEAFDTNVIVRLCVRDDEDQYTRAEKTFRRATAGAGAWLSSACSPRSPGCFASPTNSRATTATTVRRLIAIEGVHLEDEAATRLALAAFEAGSADFADYFILESARRSNALPLHTFDERLGKADGATLIE